MKELAANLLLTPGSLINGPIEIRNTVGDKLEPPGFYGLLDALIATLFGVIHLYCQCSLSLLCFLF